MDLFGRPHIQDLLCRPPYQADSRHGPQQRTWRPGACRCQFSTFTVKKIIQGALEIGFLGPQTQEAASVGFRENLGIGILIRDAIDGDGGPRATSGDTAE